VRHFDITLRDIDKEVKPSGYLALLRTSSTGAKCDICRGERKGQYNYLDTGMRVPMRNAPLPYMALPAPITEGRGRRRTATAR
jgi:hypothetical protein